MSMSNLAYARLAFQFFSRSARHIYQLIAGHQNPQTGWAYLSYACLAKESGLTRRRVMQLVAFLEANNAGRSELIRTNRRPRHQPHSSQGVSPNA